MGEPIEDQWDTTVTELLVNFRGALFALIPWMRKNRIPIDELNAYDDWDAITSILFDKMVINSIVNSKEFQYNSSEFPKYGTFYRSYKELNFIQIKSDEESKELFVFVSFVSERELELINVAVVKNLTLETIRHEKLKFAGGCVVVNNHLKLDRLTVVL